MTNLDQISGAASPYDTIAGLYDSWSRSVKEDVGFYVREARAAGGPIVELGVGTGRIAIPIGWAGIQVIGVDSSRAMLDECARLAKVAAVSDLLDLRLGDLRRPPVDERVSLVICPFRALLHMADDGERVEAFEAARALLVPDGRLIFDVFEPTADDIADTHARWLEREPDIYERADWDTVTRTLTLSVRGPQGSSTMSLAWTSQPEWQGLLEQTGFEVEACYGWFDRRPYRDGEDMIFVARRTG